MNNHDYNQRTHLSHSSSIHESNSYTNIDHQFNSNQSMKSPRSTPILSKLLSSGSKKRPFNDYPTTSYSTVATIPIRKSDENLIDLTTNLIEKDADYTELDDIYNMIIEEFPSIQSNSLQYEPSDTPFSFMGDQLDDPSCLSQQDSWMDDITPFQSLQSNIKQANSIHPSQPIFNIQIPQLSQEASTSHEDSWMDCIEPFHGNSIPPSIPILSPFPTAPIPAQRLPNIDLDLNAYLPDIDLPDLDNFDL